MFRFRRPPPTNHHTIYAFGLDIETLKYDSRFYTPIFTKGKINRREVQNLLNQMNKLVPNSRRSFWVSLCASLMSSAVVFVLIVGVLSLFFDFLDFIEYVGYVFPFIAITVILAFRKLYLKRQMRKMRDALEYYNHRMEGTGLRWYCDRVNEWKCPIVELRSVDGTDRPTIVANRGSIVATNENGTLDPLLNITSKGTVLSGHQEIDYTPYLTDGRLSMEEFTEVMKFVRVINVGIAKKIGLFALMGLLLYIVVPIILVVLGPDDYCSSCMYPIIASSYTGMVMIFTLPFYRTAKYREQRKLMQDVIDRFNPNIEPLGLRWVYPHSGRGILIYKRYLLLELGDDEDIEIDPVGENDSANIPMANINNGYNVLH